MCYTGIEPEPPEWEARVSYSGLTVFIAGFGADFVNDFKRNYCFIDLSL
jgi:hypothetical protein